MFPSTEIRTTRSKDLNIHAGRPEHDKRLRMEQGLEKELNALKADLVCAKDFKCCTGGLENLCKAKDIGLEEHLQCLEESSWFCPFSVSFGTVYYCHCHLRMHIVKMLGK